MGISIWQLLIVLAIVLVLFGAKRLRTLGTDLGSAVKGFRDSVREGEKATDDDEETAAGHLGKGESDNVIDGEATRDPKSHERH